VETLPPLVRLGMCRAGAGVAGRGERWIPDGEMASAKWHAGACGAILIAWSALFPAGSVIGSSRRTLRQWCSGGVGLVLQAWHCGRSCGAGTHLRYPVVPAVRGRTCATLWFLRCADAPALPCGSCGAGTHLRYLVAPAVRGMWRCCGAPQIGCMATGRRRRLVCFEPQMDWKLRSCCCCFPFYMFIRFSDWP